MIFYKYRGHRNKNGSVDKYWEELKQKHKKNSLFGDASASHLSLVLRHV